MDDEDFATMGQYGFAYRQGHPFAVVGQHTPDGDAYAAGYHAALGAVEEQQYMEDMMGAAIVRPRGASRYQPRSAPQRFAAAPRSASSPNAALLARLRAPMFNPYAMAPQAPTFPQAPMFQMPNWRARQLAPGVQTPGENLYELTLNPLQNNGILDAANGTISFEAIPQKPFRGERLVITINRSVGAVGVRVTRSPLTVGTEPQAANISGAGSADIYAPGAFGVRLAMSPAGAGITVGLQLSATPAVPVGETVALSVSILGRIITG